MIEFVGMWGARFDYLRRLTGTGLSFALFGLGGVCIGCLAFPLVCLLNPTRGKRQQSARWLIHKSFALHLGAMKHLGVLDYRITGLERLRGSSGELIVANHPTLIDVVFLISRLPQADCIVKAPLWNNLFTRGPVRAADYLLNDGSPELVEKCAARLRSGTSLVIFPEGTRTARNSQLNEFQRGAANIAARSGAPCRPVIIRCTPSTLTKNEKWYHIPPRRFLLSMEVGEVLPVTAIIEQAGSLPIAARRINSMLYGFFTSRLAGATGVGAAG
jgi:1-acyl-sn-glycerol-3-phosphate acyltransferase